MHGSYDTKKQAKNAITEYVLRILLERESSSSGARRYSDLFVPKKAPLEKLYDYCNDPSTDVNLSDLKFDCERTPEGRFNYKLTVKDKEYDLHKGYVSKKAAKQEIAKHVLKILLEGESSTQASSSGANQ